MADRKVIIGRAERGSGSHCGKSCPATASESTSPAVPAGFPLPPALVAVIQLPMLAARYPAEDALDFGVHRLLSETLDHFPEQVRVRRCQRILELLAQNRHNAPAPAATLFSFDSG